MVIKTTRLDVSKSWDTLLHLAAYAGHRAVQVQKLAFPGIPPYFRLLGELDFAMSKHLSYAGGIYEIPLRSVLRKYHAPAHWPVGYEIYIPEYMQTK